MGEFLINLMEEESLQSFMQKVRQILNRELTLVKQRRLTFLPTILRLTLFHPARYKPWKLRPKTKTCRVSWARLARGSSSRSVPFLKASKRWTVKYLKTLNCAAKIRPKSSLSKVTLVSLLQRKVPFWTSKAQIILLPTCSGLASMRVKPTKWLVVCTAQLPICRKQCSLKSKATKSVRNPRIV